MSCANGECPFMDDSGKLIPGCTIKTACEWLTQYGGRVSGDNVTINGTFYTLREILRPGFGMAENIIVGFETGYYGNMGFKI